MISDFSGIYVNEGETSVDTISFISS